MSRRPEVLSQDVEELVADTRRNTEDITDAKNKVTRNNIVGCMGDSITNGFGGYAYPAFLNQEDKWVVKKYSVGGYTIQDVIDNLIPLAIVDSPKVNYMCVMAGMNDVLEANPYATMVAQYNTLIDTLVLNNISPIICCVTPKTTLTDEIVKFNNYLRNYATVNGFLFVDTYSVFFDGSGNLIANYLQADDIHPTTAGYYAISNAVKAKVPYTSTEFSYFVPNETNMSRNPFFITDTNADGLANDWEKLESGITGIYSLVDNPDGGKYQQVAISGGASNTSYSAIRQTSITTGWVVGDTLELSVDIGTDGLAQDHYFKAYLVCRTGSTVILQSSILVSDLTTSTAIPLATEQAGTEIVYSKKRLRGLTTVPVGTDNIQIILYMYGTGDGVLRVGRVLLRQYYI